MSRNGNYGEVAAGWRELTYGFGRGGVWCGGHRGSPHQARDACKRIETFGNGNTHQEMLALRVWAGSHNLRSIIVPTEIFATHRVRWMLQCAFPSKFAIRVIALDPPEYGRDDRWRHVQGATALKNRRFSNFITIRKVLIDGQLHVYSHGD